MEMISFISARILFVLALTVGLCVVRVFEAFNFQITTNFIYTHNLSIYNEPRITYSLC